MMKSETRAYLLVCAISLGIAAFTWWFNGRPACEEGHLCVLQSDTWNLHITGFDHALGGLAHLEHAEAVLTFEDSDERVLLTARPYRNDEWSDEIESVVLGVNTARLASMQEPLNVYVEVDLPVDRDLQGRRATIAYLLEVSYPQLVEAADYAPGGPVWGERRAEFLHQERIVLVASPPARLPRLLLFWLPLAVSVFAALVALGSSMTARAESVARMPSAPRVTPA